MPLTTKTLLVVAAVAVLGFAACGDDDDDDGASSTNGDAATTTAPTDDVEAYCEASLAVETVPDPEVDFESATEEEIAAGLKAYATEVLQPAAADVAAAAPDELADAAEQFVATVDELAATGDASLFDAPELVEATQAAHVYDLAHCGWDSVEVTATNYAFDGLPAELDAGIVSFDLTNEGEDVHELLLVRKNDGVTQPAEELLALPEEEAMSLTTMVGTPAFAPPGSVAYLVADLEPGDYMAVCFIPVGMTSTDGPPSQGPPHAMEGMFTEFTVS